MRSNVTINQAWNGWVVQVNLENLTNVEISQKFSNGNLFVFGSWNDVINFLRELPV